jgi:hypothetical protein
VLYELNLQIRFRLISFFKVMLRLRPLVAYLSTRRPRFDARPIHLRFVLDKMAF